MLYDSVIALGDRERTQLKDTEMLKEMRVDVHG
jgi:hypothetical protein